uniref:Ig-like domain-containing protein n=1 Tax=Cyprinus carpio TaxID=7962 RepID=A0A8C1KDD9_CYPCA
MCFLSLTDLLMWSQATESLTNTAVTLGADVIINCDLDIEEIYWYKQKSPDPPELILRTYRSTYEGAEYENSIFKLKYSVKTNSRLFIRNITADELGVYYCVKTSEPRKFSNGTKIYITESHDAPQPQKSWRNLIIFIIISSVLLTSSVIIAVIGLIKSCTNSSRGCKESIRRDVKELQFAEVVLLKHLSGSSSCLTVCSFSLLQSVTDERGLEENYF